MTALGLSRRYLETPCQESVRALGCFIEMGRLFRANITEPLFELKFVMPEKRVSGILHPAVPRFGKTGASKLRTLSWSHSQVTLGRFVSTNGYSSCFCVHPPFCVHVSVWHLQWSTVDAVGRVLAHGHQLVFWANASGLSRAPGPCHRQDGPVPAAMGKCRPGSAISAALRSEGLVQDVQRRKQSTSHRVQGESSPFNG